MTENRYGIRARAIRETVGATLTAGRLTATELVAVGRAVAEQVNADLDGFLTEAHRLRVQVEEMRALVAGDPDATTVNFALIQALSDKPHKHLHIAEGEQYGLVVDGVFQTANNGVGEVMQEARTVQHLCDLAGVPEGKSYSAHIDARVFLLLAEVVKLRERLMRIGGWHAREAGPAGTVGDFCTECEVRWPCPTLRMANGTYVDEENPS